MIRVILVATDGSDHAKKAVALASEIAANCDARLVLLHVLLRDANSTTLREIAKRRALSKDMRDLLDNYEAEGITELAQVGALGAGYVPIPPPMELLDAIGAQVLDAAEAVAAKAGVKAVVKVPVHGDAGDLILEEAKRRKANIIVMGTRGFGELKGFFVGSVSHKVSEQAACAVLTVK